MDECILLRKKCCLDDGNPGIFQEKVLTNNLYGIGLEGAQQFNYIEMLRFSFPLITGMYIFNIKTYFNHKLSN